MVFCVVDFATQSSFEVGLKNKDFFFLQLYTSKDLDAIPQLQELMSFLLLTSWIPEVYVAWMVVLAKPLHYLLVVHKPV